jgi:hypothetical protein
LLLVSSEQKFGFIWNKKHVILHGLCIIYVKTKVTPVKIVKIQMVF